MRCLINMDIGKVMIRLITIASKFGQNWDRKYMWLQKDEEDYWWIVPSYKNRTNIITFMILYIGFNSCGEGHPQSAELQVVEISKRQKTNSVQSAEFFILL